MPSRETHTDRAAQPNQAIGQHDQHSISITNHRPVQEQNTTYTLTSQQRTQSITATAARERERRHWIRHRPKCILCGKAVNGIRGTLNFAHCRSRCTSYKHAAQFSMFKAMNVCECEGAEERRCGQDVCRCEQSAHSSPRLSLSQTSGKAASYFLPVE